MDLLSLPYDVRYLIYKELFPTSKQIYIQALGRKLYVRLPRSQTICLPLLRRCPPLHREATEFLYNNYLFNIMGRKSDCLATYERFVRALARHANDEVHVDAFSNGEHASTMCISVHTGNGKIAMLERRARGVPIPISSIKQELIQRGTTARAMKVRRDHCYGRMFIVVSSILLGLLVVLFASQSQAEVR